MIEIKYLAPEIFLVISIFSLLSVGVYLKNSFNIIFRLSTIIILVTLLILLTSDIENIKIFNNSIIIDDFSSFIKSLISNNNSILNFRNVYYGRIK